ncbi:hypothetical protein [Acetivibrio straminisolvens]|uniref:Uncharacterized protein n=1 Tax=Acetivibrio straminisolvens JCM 21531 TaxID=1294263 RepID=W4V137_9FIRM|nr:hypothetical protein [Acetivibrio straminisolvens]GAE86817.1 hypothetical protein JCM21531_141 [Acetivibrio straminisolvens JCM 21531]
MKKLLEKYLIVKYILTSYVKTLLISLAVVTVLFAVLMFTGLYAGIESALNLQYNSPFILVPLYGFAVLAVLCFFIGFLIYFYKYKRPKSKTKFYKFFSNILNEKLIN